MRTASAWLVLLLLTSLIQSADARMLRREVISVRIEGYVGTKPIDVPLEVSWPVTLKGDPYELHVAKLQVLTGNLAYYDIITALKPYRPALTVTGEDADLDRFATPPPGQRIAILGFLQFGGGARYLMISGVEYLGEPTPAPQPTASQGE